jgi:hypothetical protein
MAPTIQFTLAFEATSGNQRLYVCSVISSSLTLIPASSNLCKAVTMTSATLRQWMLAPLGESPHLRDRPSKSLPSLKHPNHIRNLQTPISDAGLLPTQRVA